MRIWRAEDERLRAVTAARVAWLGTLGENANYPMNELRTGARHRSGSRVRMSVEGALCGFVTMSSSGDPSEARPEVNELLLSPERIMVVGERDSLFAQSLDDSRRDFLHLLRKVPGHLQLVTEQMRAGDMYRAVIPGEVQRRIQKGEYEEVLKKGSALWTGMIRKADGSKVFVKQAEWEKVQLDPNSLATLTQIALQASIAELTEQLFVMDRKLDLILDGQNADRIAKVNAGIDLYETARRYKDSSRRDQQLGNALQSLNEGRQALFGELRAMLGHQKRDAKFTDRFWKSMGIDLPEVEFFRQLKTDRSKVAESIKYVNLASVYIFRIHALDEEHEAADLSRQQYVEFCEFISRNLNEDGPHPYEMVDSALRFRQLGQSTNELADVGSDLVIEARYEEVVNGEM